jgi:hypothetical protein
MPNDKIYELLEFAEDWTKEKYRGFMPFGSGHIMGLRYFPPGVSDPGVINLMTDSGVLNRPMPRPGDAMSLMKAGWPHHNAGIFGYWHINDEDEIYLPLTLSNGAYLLILLEGVPRGARWDRFVQYCRKCCTRLYEKAVKTGDVGIAGFWKAEEDGVNEFNGNLALRTCRNCGDVHPLAYPYFRFLKPGPTSGMDRSELW